MSEAAQRVVVIQDASKEISSSAIKWAIDGFSLKPGDELTLLGVLHHFNNPSMFHFTGASKIMGYKNRVDSSSMLGANQKTINQEVARKEEEYQNSPEILALSKLFEMKKIAFHKKVVAASSPKIIALEAAKDLKATWIILDRQMKKDRKYFMDGLSCGIARMKRDNSVELLRGPQITQENATHAEGSKTSSTKYPEMPPATNRNTVYQILQGTPDDDDLFSLEIVPMNLRSSFQSYSDDDLETDRRKGLAATRTLQPSSSTPILSENQPLMHTYLDSITESAPLEGHEFAISNKIKMQHMKINEISNREEMKDTNFTKAITKYEITRKQPACLHCRNERPRIEVQRDFTYAELHDATNGFSTENFLSEGGFGYVYKGKLNDGQWIAVKQYKKESSQGEKEFTSEVDVLSKTRHENVVMLLGSCSEESHRLLVYEYVCNGSLDIHLAKDSPDVLSWEYRMSIAFRIARGLNYLHQNNIIHRDTRPNNILVTHDYEPLLGDFGLARTQHDESEHLSKRKVVGTIGYMAPEYAERGRVSTKIDVFSFGVVLLELITGRTTGDKTLQEKGLVGWARPLLKEKKYPELIDERVLESHDVHQLFWMVRVAEICLLKDPDKRPRMEQVEHALKCIIDGETVTGIEDFSPARSSDSSMSKSVESLSEDESDMQESSGASSLITSQSFSLSSLSQSSVRSLATSTSASIKSSSSGKRNPSQRKKERNRSVFYDEMID